VRLGLSNDLKSLAPLNMAGAQKLSVLSEQYQSQAVASLERKRRCASMPEVHATRGGGVELRRGGEQSAGQQQHKGASLEQVVQPRFKKAGETGGAEAR